MKNGKINLSKMNLIFIHGSFKYQINQHYFVYDGYTWVQEKLYEYTDHNQLDANFLDGWEKPQFIDRSGNEIIFTQKELYSPHHCYERLAKEGHIIFWNAALNSKNTTYIMYHPVYLSSVQKVILKNVIFDEANMEFFEVNEQGEVKITPYKNNPDQIEKYLYNLITRTREQEKSTSNKVKIKK